MSLLALLAALLLEQYRPLRYRRLIRDPLAGLAGILESRFNAGSRQHGLVAWLIGVGGLVLVAGGVASLLAWINPLLAWLWNVLILYLAMGFGEFGRHYTAIQIALRRGELARARQELAVWRGLPTRGHSASGVARLAIEGALCVAHRHIFGVLVSFLLLPGPCGPVLYRAAAVFAEAWSEGGDAEYGDFGNFARRTFAIIDWLPVRLTAAGFAIVGDFEAALYCWRTQGDRLPAAGLAKVVASGAGALGVRLVLSGPEAGGSAGRAEFGVGDEADVDFMESAAGLVWRALVLWLLLLLLFGLASLVGS